MMKKVFFYFYILSVLLCVSCVKHSYPQALVEVDSLCYTNPKLALNKLKTLRQDFDTTCTEDWMYFRLLELKAKEKASISHSNLDLVENLISYYKDKGNMHLLLQAYYLAGTTCLEMHDSPQALDFFHKVLNSSDENHDFRLRGLTHAQIGNVMLYQGNYIMAVKHYKESYRTDSLDKDTVGMIYDLRDLAYSFSNTNKLDSTLLYGHQSLQLALKLNDNDMIESARSSLAIYFLDSQKKNIDSISKYVLPLLAESNLVNKGAAFAMAMKYYKLRNMPDSVKYYMKKVKVYGNIYSRYEAYSEELEMSLKEQPSGNNLLLWRQFSKCNDSLNKITKTDAVSRCQSLYDYTMRERENSKLKMENERHRFGMVLQVLLLIIAIMLFCVYYRKSVFKRKEQERQMMEMQRLLKNKEKPLYEYEDILAKIKETKIYILLLAKTQKCENLKNIEWEEIDNMVNEYFDDFKIKLYRIGDLSELEYRTCLLLKIRFPLSNIAEAIHRSPSALSMLRKRLYKKLFQKSGKPEELDAFIRLL